MSIDKSVAIIGMSGRFPHASSVGELFKNLAEGRASVGPVSARRLKETTLPPDGKYRHCGYLDDIDKFDHKLFNISYAEAINMSPAHRMLLEVVYETFENAGYNPDVFNGQNVSVYASDSVANDYAYHADEINPTLVTGNSSEFLATKVSRSFNLLGNSVVLNTACSSSLVALNAACNELVLGDAGYALVCGVNVNVLPVSSMGYDMGLSSPDGISRAFSAQPGGMSFGETVCAILLKPYARAIADGDNIHAVIRGCAVNNNGSKSSSILAPHSQRQAEVITKAWRKAGIDPVQIGYIEAHGSGTELGDSLEIEGLTLAYRQFTDRKQFVPISTLKSNIGHCMLAAGLAGIVKAALALRHRVIFPNIYCDTLNPHINFKEAPVYVNTTFRKWESESVRYAGVTSLGRGGVNGHVVLEEFVPGGNNPEPQNDPVLITLSGNTSLSLQENKKRLRAWLLDHPHATLRDVAFTLANGRRHHTFRWAATCSSVEQLIAALEQSAGNEVAARAADKIFLLFGDERISGQLITYCIGKYPEFADAVSGLVPDAGESLKNGFMFQLGLYHVLKAQAITSGHFISMGTGKYVKDVILNRISLQQAIALVEQYVCDEGHDPAARITAFLEKENAKAMLILGFGKPGKATRVLAENPKVQVIHLAETFLPDGDPVSDLLAALYTESSAITWSTVFSSLPGKRIELPSYAFEKTRCWLREEPRKKEQKESVSAKAVAGKLSEAGNEFEKLVAAAFGEVLEIERLSLTDDFFELGGNSLKATKVVSHLNQAFGFDLNFEDLFDFPTVSALAAHLSSHINIDAIVKELWCKTLKLPDVKPGDDFFDLGGHSLLANQVINQVRKLLNVSIDFEDFFRNSSLEKLTAWIRRNYSLRPADTSLQMIQAAEPGAYYPVSFAQQRILFMEQFYKTGTAYNTPNIFWVEGDLNVDRLKQAFQALVDRHEPLRTSFHYADGKPVQTIADQVTLDIHTEDWTGKGFDIQNNDAVVGEIIAQFVRPFDLSQPPLMRVTLIGLEERKWILLSDMSHIVTDRTTKRILVEEFLKLYQGVVLPPLKIQYKDYTVWQHQQVNSGAYMAQEKFWLETYREPVPELNLPTDYPRPATIDNRGDVYDFAIPGELAAGIRELAHRHDATVYIVVLAALQVLLHKLTRNEDIVIGAPYAQRNNSVLENMVGILLNTITFRNYPKPGLTFAEFLEQVKENAFKVYKNSGYQFEMLLDKIAYKRKPNRSALFDVLLNSQTVAAFNGSEPVGPAAGGLKFTPYHYKDTSTGFDLSIDVDEFKKFIHFRVYFRTSLFARPTIAYMMAEFTKLLSQVTESPAQEIASFNIFQSHERSNVAPKLKIKNKLKHYQHDIC